MNTYIENIENGVQIRINDNDSEMKIHNKIIKMLDENPVVENKSKFMTFETPISEYKYKKTPFSVLFDEMVDETFIFVDKEYDYSVIESLIQRMEL